MGVFYDLGRPVIGGWLGGPWISQDPVRKTELIWGGEFGQEGAVLFAVDAQSGQVVERHWIGAREFGVTVEESGRIWVHNYHGLNQPGNLLQSWAPQSRQLVSHGFPPLSGQRFVSALLGPDGWIYLGTHPYGHLVSFDPRTGEWRDCGPMASPPIVPDQHIWCRPQAVGERGEIACSIVRNPGAEVVAFDPVTGKRRVLERMPERLASAQAKPRISADIHQGTYVVDGQERRFHYHPSVATDIVGLNKGPDGKIYGSTIISMHVFCFDPQTRKLEDLGRVGWGGGEIYDVIACGDKLYMGSYTGAYWAVYDPSRPWNPCPEAQGMAAQANPRNYGMLGEDLNRPFEYALGPDGRIYIACRANYGFTGGGLAWFDPRTEEKRIFRDLEQSVQCVAADERYVYGGTSIRGGRGCIDPTTQAKVFIFDPVQQQRIYTCIPVAQAIAVTSLAASPVTKLVYGSTDTGHLFAFDRDERQVVQTWQLRSLGTPLMGVPEAYGIIHLVAGSDGDIYGVTRTDVFKLDVSTDRLAYLDQPPIPDLYQIVEGAPGVFYIGARGHLLEYHLKDTPHFR
ncbi:MAG: PQQ-like beta-propeller repeat protein [Candidatus Latescibacteria bacterium]|nr:PQQ-like beta-propeller repeat protein [Candidatus Latescibacterota bacterium]